MSYGRTSAPRILVFLLLALMSGLPLSAQTAGDVPRPDTEWNAVYHSTYLKTIAGNTYAFHSAGASLSWRNRWSRPLLTTITVFLPLGVNNNGTWFGNLSSFYESYMGAELILAWEALGPWGSNWKWRLAPGWSIKGISLKAKTGILPFESLTTGPSLRLTVDRHWQQGIMLQFTAGLSYHVFDLIHSVDKLQRGVVMFVGFGLGFRRGAFMGRYMDDV